MAVSDRVGAILTTPLSRDGTDIDEMAKRLSEMWLRYNEARRQALSIGEEARRFIFATDIDQTSAVVLPHVNRTHQPKLTQLSDTLQSQYFEASLSMPMFFKYECQDRAKYDAAHKVEAWVRTKMEQRKFRETTGRELIADYTNYGNCFVTVDYVVEKDDAGTVLYRGPQWKRVSPLDIVMNAHAESFGKSPKIVRKMVHVSELSKWPEKFPEAEFNKDRIADALKVRTNQYMNDWIDLIKERGIQMDGYGGFNTYFKSDMAEVLIYRGSVFDPETGDAQSNRVIYVVDRTFIIRNAASRSPTGFDGIHHAGWRVRNDNLWAQGAFDNLLGLQYRIDHLENLKADVFDLIAHPVIKIKGDSVMEPAGGWRPGATYYCGTDSDVDVLKIDSTALNADNQIAVYHRMMEDFAGAPPETRGIRTPGEKTAFEVNKLDQNAAMMFVDKARNFERMLETMLKETFELMMINYDGGDYVEIFDDIAGQEKLVELSKEDVNQRGTFTAIGARFWTRRNRETLEIQNFMSGPMKDPKIRAHIDGWKLADYLERKMLLDDEGIFAQFSGVKEDAAILGIQQAEQQRHAATIQNNPNGNGPQAGGAPGEQPTTDNSPGKPVGAPQVGPVSPGNPRPLQLGQDVGGSSAVGGSKRI